MAERIIDALRSAPDAKALYSALTREISVKGKGLKLPMPALDDLTGPGDSDPVFDQPRQDLLDEQALIDTTDHATTLIGILTSLATFSAAARRASP